MKAFIKSYKPVITGEQFAEFAQAIDEERHPYLLEDRVRKETAQQIFSELENLKDKDGNYIFSWEISQEKGYKNLKKKYGVRNKMITQKRCNK